ncbi:radical SAM protein [Candidatus Woesearchaeota archaeon]|nr:radical SAM protein [Candidatus Woesearchaeota archaeon]
MAELQYETLSFLEKEDDVVVTLLKLFKTSIPKAELAKIAGYKIEKNKIVFNLGQKKAEFRFGNLLSKHFEYLTNIITGNYATYIHRNSGIPLIGNVAFGIVYRESSIVEIKPVTSCNLDCVYCSISEGISSKKNDFVVEEAYMIEELEKFLGWLDEDVEIHIGVQGEPFLYQDMALLISDIQKMKRVHTISIDTNGTLLSKEKIDDLSKNSKLQVNMSLDAIDEKIAKDMAGVKNYNVKHVKNMIAYASEKLNVILAPVLTVGYNEKQMEDIILFVKSLKKQPILGIQNFLQYKTGRSPGKEMSWDDFYALLEKLEKKHDIKLKLQKEDFDIRKLKPLEKPFIEGDEVDAVIKCQDRFTNSVIAVSKDRNISVPGVRYQKEKKIKVKIVRDKHNIFTGKIL